MKSAYIEFLHNLPFYGLAVLCGDDAVVQEIIPKLERKYLTYGLDANNDFVTSNIQYAMNRSRFDVRCPSGTTLSVTLNVTGVHNVLNATAAIAIAKEEGISDKHILRALSTFAGIGRRFQVLGEYSLPTSVTTRSDLEKEQATNNEYQSDESESTITLVDDYGHHPTEVDMTIAAARSNWPKRRLVMVYQPHRFTRTRDLYEDFVATLSKVDVLLLLDVYAASEQAIEGVDSKSLCRSVRLRGKVDPIYVGEPVSLYSILQDVLKEQDVVFLQGAGNVGNIAADLAKYSFDLVHLNNLAKEKADSAEQHQ
jgi:UDP-N-acetylmuramate--alanine ligase